MPFKSQAQRRMFHAKAAKGEIPEETVERWERETPDRRRLPEKVSGAARRLRRHYGRQ